MNGGIGVSIGSQMTQEEIEAYATRMLAVASLNHQQSGEAGIDGQYHSMRVNIVCQVINACGRPIAKAEQEQMAIMTENLKRQGAQRGPSPVVLREGAFGSSNGEES